MKMRWEETNKDFHLKEKAPQYTKCHPVTSQLSITTPAYFIYLCTYTLQDMKMVPSKPHLLPPLPRLLFGENT